MSPGNVAILVPVLNRPQRVAPLVASITNATPEPHAIYFLCDPGDRAEQDAVAMAGCRMFSPGGSYAHKINQGVALTDEPLLFFGADDLHFHPGWLPAALEHLTDGIGVVGTNDLGNSRVIAGEHATHQLVTRAYCQRGAIDGGGPLHEGYRHMFVDDEFVQTAKHRGAWAFAADSIVEHLHPDWGKADRDATYNKGRATYRLDRLHFHRVRRPLWM